MENIVKDTLRSEIKKVSFATAKAEPILAKFGDIIVYDINCKENAETRVEFMKCLTEALEEQIEKGITDINSENALTFGYDLLLKIFPILTNYSFDGMTELEITSVFESPNPTLVEVNNTLSKVVTDALLFIENAYEFEVAKAQANKDPKQVLLDKAKQEEKARKKAALLKQVEELELEMGD